MPKRMYNGQTFHVIMTHEPSFYCPRVGDLEAADFTGRIEIETKEIGAVSHPIIYFLRPVKRMASDGGLVETFTKYILADIVEGKDPHVLVLVVVNGIANEKITCMYTDISLSGKDAEYIKNRVYALTYRPSSR